MKDSQVSYSESAGSRLEQNTPTIKIAFLDVGQGDTIVISCPDTHEAIVVDCIDSNSVLDYLEQEKIRYLRGIVVSHLHDDHYKQVDDLLYRHDMVPSLQECENLAFVQILNSRNVDDLLRDSDGHQEQANLENADEETQKRTKGTSSSIAKKIRTTTLRNMYDWCWSEKRRYKDPSLEEGIKPLPFKGTLTSLIDVVHPYKIDLIKWATTLNNTSVVMRVKGPGSNALLTGDLEPKGWNELQKMNLDLRSDVLKFPHHGGAWDESATRSLLDAIQPSIVVISVGTEGEKYSHPNKSVFDVLSSPPYSNIRILCTQATNQCRKEVLSQKESVTKSLDHLALSQGRERIGSKRGCPCAGSIVIELKDKAYVLQPTTIFHRDNIITPHFISHKCIFPLKMVLTRDASSSLAYESSQSTLEEI